MTDKVNSETPETVVAEVPKEISQPTEDTPGIEPSVLSKDIDALRSKIENKVFEESKLPEEEAVVAEKPAEDSPKPKAEDEGAFSKVKERIQKRIDKITFQKKTAEERVAELEAEVANLKNAKTEPVAKVDEKREPTDTEIRLALKGAREDGDIDLEAQILEYMAERKANKIADERIAKLQESQQVVTKTAEKEQQDWVNLNRDYLVYDENGKVDASHPLNLANQSGLLYQTAMALYQDKDLHNEFYSDKDRIQGFRRAVADSYREIVQQGLYKPKAKETLDVTPKRKPQLVEPDADTPEEASAPAAIISDADKVRDEIKHRRKSPLFRQSSY